MEEKEEEVEAEEKNEGGSGVKKIVHRCEITCSSENIINGCLHRLIFIN